MSMTFNRTDRTRSATISKQRIQPISYALIPFSARNSLEQDFSQRLASTLSERARVIAIGRARSGVFLLSRYAAERTKRRKVLLSPYTLPDVINMVVLAGLEPSFFDHEPYSTRCDLDHLEHALDDDTACVFLTHYHVNELRVRTIRELCNQRGAYLFDDCALAFGGAVDEQPIGTLAQASIFSFSSFKLMNFFWGGAIATEDPDIAAWIEHAVADWPRLKLRDYAKQARVCVLYDMATRPGVFSGLVFPYLLNKANGTSSVRSLEHVRLESVGLDRSLTSKPHPSAFAEWLRKLPNTQAWLSGRRTIAAIYDKILSPHAVSGPITKADFQGSTFVNYPVKTTPNRRDTICLAMMRQGFDIGRSLYPNCHKLPSFAGFSGKSENVDILASSAVYLPTHYGVTEDYARAIATSLSEQLD